MQERDVVRGRPEKEDGGHNGSSARDAPSERHIVKGGTTERFMEDDGRCMRDGMRHDELRVHAAICRFPNDVFVFARER